MVGTIHQNHESMCHDRADFAVYGTKGILLLGDPNQFGNPVRLLQTDGFEEPIPQTLEEVGAYSANPRGLGAAEMADAVLSVRKNRASKEQAYHVLDILECMEKGFPSGMFMAE